jgi:hypothetical protein
VAGDPNLGWLALIVSVPLLPVFAVVVPNGLLDALAWTLTALRRSRCGRSWHDDPQSPRFLIVLGDPTTSWQTRRRAAARAAILAAAWAVAREHGLAALTLREVAARVGMGSPSLYTHFPSKNAVYDAMFGQAWEDYEAVVDAMEPGLPANPRAALTQIARNLRLRHRRPRPSPADEPADRSRLHAQR